MAEIAWIQLSGENSTEVYFDGHERGDVKEHRMRFFNQILESRKQMITFGSENMTEEILGEMLEALGTALYVLVSHDETTVYSKGGLSRGWGHDRSGRHVQKGRGEARIISAFCSELLGWLKKSA